METRHTLVKLRPALRQHWVALAVAYHLNKNLAEARRTMEHYQRTLKVFSPYSSLFDRPNSLIQNVTDYDVEHSETLLYHICILEEMEDYSEALAILDVNAKSRSIVDRTAIMETRGTPLPRLSSHLISYPPSARLLTKLGSNEAKSAWRTLIDHNSDCYDYYRGYLANLGLSLGKRPFSCPVGALIATRCTGSGSIRHSPGLLGPIPKSRRAAPPCPVHIYRVRLQRSCQALPPQRPNEGNPLSLRRHKIALQGRYKAGNRRRNC